MRFLSLALICVSIFAPATLSAAPSAYTILDLGSTSQRDVFLNERGQVAFSADGKAFRYTDNVGLEFLASNPYFLLIGGINDRGQVSMATSGDGVLDIQRYSDGVGLESLAKADALLTLTRPNNLGDIAYADTTGGYYIGITGVQCFATPWLPGIRPAVYDMNDSGTVLSSYVYPVSGGGGAYSFAPPDDYRRLTPLLSASALNNLGGVIGTTDQGPAIRWANGTVTQLGGSAFGRDINDAGAWVGNQYLDEDATEAWLGTKNGMVILNTLIDPALGWNLAYARSINNAGQIGGTGFLNGQRHAFRLAPTNSIPEPGSLALLCVSILPLLAALRRRPKP
ncbi:MAG TPA: PEP-CTERM sorting domain-containing protein [Armatimonadota bacterium]|jgi:hypothetical protein